MKTKLVLFTVDHLEFSSMVMEPLLNKYGDSIEYVYVSRSHFDFRFIKRRFWFFMKNRYPFCIRMDDLLRFALWKWRGRKNARGHRSMVEHLRCKGFNADFIGKINDAQTLVKLKEHNADAFLFCVFDKIAGPEFLKIPKIGTFNLHMGLLPEYRGGLSAFWVLRFGEELAGATLHEATAELDGGDIVAEVRFPIRTKSMKDLMTETMEKTSRMLVEGVDRIVDGDYTAISKEGRRQGYYFIPERKDYRAFYARGCRLI